MRTTSPHFGCSVTSGTRWSAPHLSPPSSTGKKSETCCSSASTHSLKAMPGELFNGAGKTDILIRVDDRNIFIGECKVWSGPRTMDDVLKQLFGYLVWRDTKAAILLFIRNKDVTAVIDNAIAKIKEHPNHKRCPAHRAGADQYEFTMHADGDPEREIHLTLIPFALRPTAEVPTTTIP